MCSDVGQAFFSTKILIAVATLWCTSVLAGNSDNITNQISPGNEYLTFGFLPMETPVALFKRFAPLRDYLSAQIRKEIRLETARDFQSFTERTAQRQYDIVFTAPHLALTALDSKSYEAAATFIEPLKSVVVVNAKSEITNASGLMGKIISTPPDQAIVTMVGTRYLADQGLQAVRYKTYLTHNAAYSAVLGGEADAAIIANFIANKAIASKIPLKIIAQTDSFPGIGVLVARDLPESLKRDIKLAIWGMKDLPQGKKILKIISQPGYGEVKSEEFEILRPYLKAALP